MSEIWGVAIPGLAMAASEMPTINGLLRLDNPEIGSGPSWPGDSYSLADIAKLHAQRIAALNLVELTIIGMSMGGMIASILASEFRGAMPAKSNFRILVSSPSLPTNPAITKSMLAGWLQAKPGNVGDFQKILSPFFAPAFRKAHPKVAESYYRYRAFGENAQKPQALFRQIDAISTFDGHIYWPKIDPKELTTIGGAEDKVLGPSHSADLKSLSPGAQHIQIADLGHMANLEMPALFHRRLDL